jgi:hypothetical protein
MALGPELEPAGIANQLRQLRQQALASAKRPRLRNYQLLATAALLLIAVTVGLWTIQYQDSEAPQMTAQGSDAVPDLYEELDFYLWLAGQNGNDAPREDETALATVSAPAAALSPGQGYSPAQMLAGKDGIPWGALSKQEQKLLQKHRRSWSGYSSREQEKLRRGARGYLELSPGQRDTVKQKHRQYEKMSPQKRKQLREEYRRQKQRD